MSYFLQLVAAANTARTAPVTADISFRPMLVHMVEIVHPTGCASLVGVWFDYRGARLWPINTDSYFLGNGSPIRFSPNLELSLAPLVLRVAAYNDDEFRIHRPLINLDVEFLSTPAHEQAGPLARLLASVGLAAPARG